REHLKDKIDELAMNSKNKNIRDLYRGINDFKRGYQPSSNLVKDENGDLLSDSHILSRWTNYFSQLLNVHSVSDVRQIEMHTVEPLIPDHSPFEFEIAIAMMKKSKSPGSDQIPAKLIQAGCKILRLKIHKLITSIWNKEELLISGKSLLYQFTRSVIELTVVIIGDLSPYRDEIIGDHQCGF
ncbi:hypothetical protein B7P43_G12259, partial [Cryptotermes secundus]